MNSQEWAERNIPAYAGKTLRAVPCVLAWAEHPRVCGENIFPWNLSTPINGTSPRMRGKLGDVFGLISNRRNIPAYAGKTVTLSMRCCVKTEHPRVCGENVYDAEACSYYRGTSPRMRGKLKSGPVHPGATRNIPAYAGKTFSPPENPHDPPEHPRVCGENPLRAAAKRSISGTSPRMRGKR